MMIGTQEILMILLFLGWWPLIVLPFWKIFSKAGFPGWISLLMVVPVLNVLALFYLAYAEWPMHQMGRRVSTGGPNS